MSLNAVTQEEPKKSKRYAANMHDTLQHRHELLCSPGISIRAFCYDTVRHHILTYSNYDLPPSPSKNPLIPNPILTEHTLRLFSLKREIKSRRLFDDDTAAVQYAPNAVTMHLLYASTPDVFVCVYAMPRDDVCGVEILEPASLDKLYRFRGGASNMIQCSAMEGDINVQFDKLGQFEPVVRGASDTTKKKHKRVFCTFYS
ncbi:hypothetical protein DYB35_003788 [Aphanomyces astaci]|uniref:Uncharacterized protein n=1 Tax=Aphanomyces astaci TaxID=112090 RepID=A0A418DM37_APHAT|nr:hypothetical protein DYB35_003788 [Aphanomyces astaci]